MAKEALAFLVLFEFPVELLSAIVAGKWATNYTPYPPFIAGQAGGALRGGRCEGGGGAGRSVGGLHHGAVFMGQCCIVLAQALE